MESYLLFTITSPQECSQKGFALPQAAQFHLSGGNDNTKPLSRAKLLSLVVTAEDNNMHDIYGSACSFLMFGIIKCAKASCLLILFRLFVSLHYIISTVLSIVHRLMDECLDVSECEPLLLRNVFVLSVVYIM